MTPPAEPASHSARDRLLTTVGVGFFVLLVALFLLYRAAAVFELYQKGVRHDALLLIVGRDLSAATFLLCGAFLLSSLVRSRGKAQRIALIVVLLLSACSFGISATLERRMRSQIQKNFEQLRHALEGHDLEQEPAEQQPTHGESLDP